MQCLTTSITKNYQGLKLDEKVKFLMPSERSARLGCYVNKSILLLAQYFLTSRRKYLCHWLPHILQSRIELLLCLARMISIFSYPKRMLRSMCGLERRQENPTLKG